MKLTIHLHHGPSLSRALSQKRCLVGGLSNPRPGLSPRSVYVGFVVGKLALGHVFLFEYFGIFLSASFFKSCVPIFHSCATDMTLSYQLTASFDKIRLCVPEVKNSGVMTRLPN